MLGWLVSMYKRGRERKCIFSAIILSILPITMVGFFIFIGIYRNGAPSRWVADTANVSQNSWSEKESKPLFLYNWEGHRAGIWIRIKDSSYNELKAFYEIGNENKEPKKADKVDIWFLRLQ